MDSTDTDGFLIEKESGTCRITINNAARRNALNRAMWAALPTVIDNAECDDDVNVIVLTGVGDKAFCAGADISEFDKTRTGDAALEYDRLNNAAFTALEHCTKPIIAMINGFAFGGGFQIAACCDLRIATKDALFAIPAAKLGIGYNPRWIKTLLTLLSPADLKEILYTGGRFSANDMKAMGFVNHVTAPNDPDALNQMCKNLATTMAANAPLSIRAAKLAINAIANAPENPDLDALDKAVQDCFESQDYAEGRQAFMQKRTPKYTGK